jgi:hypothetical protein
MRFWNLRFFYCLFVCVACVCRSFGRCRGVMKKVEKYTQQKNLFLFLFCYGWTIVVVRCFVENRILFRNKRCTFIIYLFKQAIYFFCYCVICYGWTWWSRGGVCMLLLFCYFKGYSFFFFDFFWHLNKS